MTTATENTCTESYINEIEGLAVDPTGGEEPSIDPEDEELGMEEPAPPEGFEQAEAESALVVLWHDLLAIPMSDVRSFKVSATHAVGLGLAYGEAFGEDRPLFEQAFKPGSFDCEEHADLQLRAKAFWLADIKMRQTLHSEGPFRLLVLEAKPLRKKLFKAAEYLWSDDPELGDVVANIRSGNGHANKADDLGALAALFTEYWDQAEGQCGVTLEDIARAKQISGNQVRHLPRVLAARRSAAGAVDRSVPAQARRCGEERGQAVRVPQGGAGAGV